MAAPRTITIPPLSTSTHRATLICLHGLGDTGAGWSFLAENWRRRGKFPDVSFVFPSAPAIPITVNMGMKMPGWYDIKDFDSLNRSDDEVGILRTREFVRGLIRGEMEKGIPARRIVLGGFSQGGAVALFSGLTFEERLGGVFGLSCYQLMEGKFVELRRETGEQMPRVFMGHGREDPLVRCEWGRRTAEGLKQRGIEVDWNEYEGLVHSAAPEEIDHLEAWVEKRLGEEEEGGG